MKTVETKIYKCEFCRKYGLSKSNIKKHEQFCFGNPINVPKCFMGCKHLTSCTAPISGKYYKCAAKNKGLITKKSIVLGKDIAHLNAIEMPILCHYFEEENISQEYDSDGLPF